MAASQEHHLVLLQSVVKSDVQALRDTLSDPATDLSGFLQFAHRHQLGAFTSWTLRQHDLTGSLPARAVAAMRASSLVTRRRTERQLLQLRCLADLFDREDVDALFMKGPLFAHRFYGSMEPRGFSDLDVLIQAPDLGRIDSMLLSAGYERAHRVLLSQRVSRYFSHHFEYRQDGLPLDVHWTLQRHFTFTFDYARIRETSTLVTLQGRAYRATSSEYELVLQIVGVITDLQVGQLTLRGFVDIYRVLCALEPTTDWVQFFETRRAEHILRPCRYVLAAMLDVLDCREQFPKLASQLQPTLDSLPPTARASRAVLASSKVDIAQKFLAFRLYERSTIASFSWWLVSLPFRLAVYSDVRR